MNFHGRVLGNFDNHHHYDEGNVTINPNEGLLQLTQGAIEPAHWFS